MNRTMELFNCRIQKELKTELLKAAAEEKRTANKLVCDAISIYLCMDEEGRTKAAERAKELIAEKRSIEKDKRFGFEVRI